MALVDAPTEVCHSALSVRQNVFLLTILTGCDDGTFAIGWGSGTANFPYLITPDAAIQAEVNQNGKGFYESVLEDYAYAQISALARRVHQVDGVCLVFANPDSGEAYITVDRDEGNLNNLTLWHSGDTMIANVISECNSTVVVFHSVGAVNIEAFMTTPTSRQFCGQVSRVKNLVTLLWTFSAGKDPQVVCLSRSEPGVVLMAPTYCIYQITVS
jgi:hypothetical protein